MDQLVYNIFEKLLANRHTISTAESCTGGSIASRLVKFSGISQVFLGSIVAYSNEAKTNILNVSSQEISNYGAVSEQVVKSMAIGSLKAFSSDWAIATTGIAGPLGGSLEKPIGMVYFAIISKYNNLVWKEFFNGERSQIIDQSVSCALEKLYKSL